MRTSGEIAESFQSYVSVDGNNLEDVEVEIVDGSEGIVSLAIKGSVDISGKYVDVDIDVDNILSDIDFDDVLQYVSEETELGTVAGLYDDDEVEDFVRKQVVDGGGTQYFSATDLVEALRARSDVTHLTYGEILASLTDGELIAVLAKRIADHPLLLSQMFNAIVNRRVMKVRGQDD